MDSKIYGLMTATIVLAMLFSQAAALDNTTFCQNDTILIRSLLTDNGTQSESITCEYGCDYNYTLCRAPPQTIIRSDIDPNLMFSAWGASIIIVIVILCFFLWPSVNMRVQMLGRTRKGYGVMYVREKNGKKVSHVVKFDKTIKLKDREFFPDYSLGYVYSNEYNYPSIEFDAKNTRAIQVIKGKVEIDGKKYESKMPDGKYEMPTQVKPEEELSSLISPEELMNITTGAYQLGLLKNSMFPEELKKMLMIAIILSGASLGATVYLLLKITGAFQ